MNAEKFINTILRCSSCDQNVAFELIEDIECNWGSHNVIQCPNCEELFSIDTKCPAFQDLLNLLDCNTELLTKKEQLIYVTTRHPI
ncbi:MAG: hypothetical protein OEM18_05190 [Nitrosopumilus sp.]|nr:hypothetical protein [Nitrosopumilus sp.]MDH3501796.1 hypothetical protein [Nitrosopumilus sp.]